MDLNLPETREELLQGEPTRLYDIVVDFFTYKDTTKPYLTLRQIKTGEEIKTRIKQSKIYKEAPFGLYALLRIDGFTWDYKKKEINGTWQTSDQLEPILKSYDIVKE